MKKRLISLYRGFQRLRKYKWGNLWNFRHGFLQSTIEFCSITKSNYKEFVSDVEFQGMHPLNKAFSGIIDNKVYLPYLFANYIEFVPTFFYFKDKDGFLPLMEKRISAYRVTAEDVIELLKSEGKLVLKHTYSEVGRGFILLEYNEGLYYKNKVKTSKGELCAVLDSLDEYIVEAFVSQHSLLNRINSSSLNTLRLLLVWSSEQRSFVLARCFQRFGCNGNVVDNLGSGNGILVYVDVNTGKYMDYGVVNIESKGDVFVKGLVHPNSGFVFSGNEVPNFKMIKDEIIEMLNSVSFLKFVALDVAITEDGFKLIETNSYPDPAVAQYNFGFKSDKNFDYFFDGQDK